MHVDSKEATIPYEEFLDGENRYAALKITFPDNAERLFKEASDDALDKYKAFKRQEEE